MRPNRSRTQSCTFVSSPPLLPVSILPASRARADLFRVLERVARDHETVTITARHGNAVLVAEDDWRAIQETLYLLSVPGLRESVHDGRAEPVGDCSEDPGWA